MKIDKIRVSGLQNPIGYALSPLRLSWLVTETEGRKTACWRIEVRKETEDGPLLWEEEGPAASRENEEEKTDPDFLSHLLPLPLSPRTRCHVSVRVQADNGDEASGTAFFETAKEEEPWAGRWIKPREEAYKEDTAEREFHPVFLRRFSLSALPQRARLYITGLGLYAAELNGKPVGDEILTPYFSDYHTEVQYQTYDITPLLKEDNLLSVSLGNGWYKGRFGLQGKNHLYGSEFMLLAELRLTYADGREEVIGTDDAWTYKGSDTTLSGIYDGEDLDRLAWEGRENPERTPVYGEAEGKVIPRLSLPIRKKEALPVREVLYTPAGETVLDFGQNFAGLVSFLADFPKGTRITLDFGEILQNGCFYRGNYRSARARFTYVSDGKKEEVQPRFTYFGFRYVRVTGWKGELDPASFTGWALYSDMDQTGSITTGHEKLNRLFQNALWGQKSNFLDLPTDCPQRDERLGWTGDAQVFSGTACYNLDSEAFYDKFCHDLSVEQKKLSGLMPGVIPVLEPNIAFSAVWGDIATFLPDVLYERYADKEALRLQYPMMKAWVDYIDAKDTERGRQYLFNFSSQLGDWLALDGRTEQSLQGATDEYFIGSCYYAMSAAKTAHAARVLGCEEDAKRYEALAGRIREAVLNDYFTATGRLSIDTQTAYIVALYAGIYRDKEVLTAALRERFYKDCFKIKGGFVGAPILCRVLAENGMTDLAYYFLLQEGYPGWLHCVDLGATTIWERWNSVLDNGLLSGTMMNSLNHYAFGSVLEFVYAFAAGIRPAKPGFSEAILAPVPDKRLGYLRASCQSKAGLYRSEWEILENGDLHLLFEVPFDCTARAVLPYYEGEEVPVLSAGVHEFTYHPSRDLLRRYDESTLIGDMWKDEETQEVLRKTSPLLAWYLDTGNTDYLYETLTTLRRMFFMGFSKEEVDKIEKAVYSLR